MAEETIGMEELGTTMGAGTGDDSTSETKADAAPVEKAPEPVKEPVLPVEAARPPEPEKKEAAPAPKEEKKEPPKEPEVKSPVEVAKPAAESAKPASEAAPAPAEAKAPTPEEIRGMEQKLQEGMTKHYAFTEAEKPTETELKGFIDDPATAVPGYMSRILPGYVARAGLSLYYAVNHSIGSQLPNVVQTILQSTRAQEQGFETFYSKFPALRDAKYNPVVEQSAKLFSAMNPTIKGQQAAEAIGKIAMAYLGLHAAPPTPPVSAAPPAPPPPAPHKPALPAAGGPGPVNGSGDEALGFREMFEVV